MADKIRLEEAQLPPTCPHCKTALRKVHWHKIEGGPGMVNYIALLSCPHCKVMLGAVGA